jgi:hypothetical protein
MGTTQTTVANIVDLDYVAVCIAEQIVRIKISAVHHAAASDHAHETSVLLARPLCTLAQSLGIKEHVDALVSDALPGAI